METRPALDPQIQELLDRAGISDCLNRYARGVDRVNEDLIRSAFWEDAHDEHGAVSGSVDDFLAWFLPNQPTREAAQHILSNHTVSINGDVATAETYFTSVAKHEHNDQLEQVGGRYLDTFAKRDGQWRILNRLVILDWQSVSDASGMKDRLSRSRQGSRTDSDPSFAHLAQ
jgi:propanediol dehydratase large subunit